jgi:flagellar hook protein FlgE
MGLSIRLTVKQKEKRGRSMSGNGLFQTSTLGMRAQAHQLNTIGYNIANVNTGGFKRIDTQFETILSDNQFQHRDLGGVKPYARATNDVQGRIQQSNNVLDLAIAGQGFFAVQPSLTGSDNIFYTRDGAFEIGIADGQTSSVTADDGSTITVSNGYLVDKNGLYLRGSPIESDGTFSTGSAAPMRVDQFAFINLGQATTQAVLELNLPSENNFGDIAESFTFDTYDSNGTARNISFDFSKTLTDNTWRIDSRADNLTTGTLSPGSAFSVSTTATTALTLDNVGRTIEMRNTTTGIPVAEAFSGLAVGDQITLAGTASNNSTFTITAINSTGSTITVTEAITAETTTGTASATSTATLTENLVFSELGRLQSPTELTYTATWDDGATSNFTIDISGMTQFDGGFTPFRTSQDGFAAASLNTVSFNTDGEVIGLFSDGTERAIYKVPLYDFTNPNGLDSENGLLFQQTPDSGEASAFFADETGQASFQPNAQELSNVDIAFEFTRMIQTQNAYNMNATSFKTIDEMLTVARDLKT